MQSRVLCRDVTTFHRDIITESHGVTSQNTVIVILIALRTTKNTPLETPFPQTARNLLTCGVLLISQRLCVCGNVTISWSITQWYGTADQDMRDTTAVRPFLENRPSLRGRISEGYCYVISCSLSVSAQFNDAYWVILGARGGAVVWGIASRLEGHGFDSRCDFSLT